MKFTVPITSKCNSTRTIYCIVTDYLSERGINDPFYIGKISNGEVEILIY